MRAAAFWIASRGENDAHDFCVELKLDLGIGQETRLLADLDWN